MVTINPQEVRDLRGTGMPIRDIAEKLRVKRKYIEDILAKPVSVVAPPPAPVKKKVERTFNKKPIKKKKLK